MATMNVSLPDKMKQWVEKQVASGRYANASDYVRDLIRQDQDEEGNRKAAVAELQALVNEGLQGDPVKVDFDEIREEVNKELGIAPRSDAA